MMRIWCSIILILLITIGCKDDPKIEEAKVDKSSMIDLISQEISSDPDNSVLYHKRAGVHYEKGMYNKAIEDSHKAISLDSLKPEYYHLLADSYLDNAQSRDAMAVMNRVVMLFPKRIASLLKLSEYQLILKLYDNSMLTLNEIIRQDPQNAEAYFMLGMNFMETGDKGKAINSFQTAVEMDSDLIDGWIMLGELHEDDMDKALTYYDNAILVSEGKPEPYHAKAFFLQNHGQIDDAIAIYKELNVSHPDYTPGFMNLGILYMERDEADKAYETFNIIAQTHPEDPTGYYYRAQAQFLQGNIDAAIADVGSALNINPDYPEANALLEKLNQLKSTSVE